MSWMETMLLRSLREGGMTRLAARMGVDAGAVGRGPVAGAVDLLAGGLARTLRDDGTLAAAAMLDGRALALMPVSIRIR